jgi:hypothetical protein
MQWIIVLRTARRNVLASSRLLRFRFRRPDQHHLRKQSGHVLSSECGSL